MNETAALPRLSIVTPCLNRAHMIERAVESVMNQDYPNVEHVIADGGSTDGTLDVLKKYPHLRVVSEPDRNLYDGLNKGIQAATGDVIGHLNSDDFYVDNVFGSVMKPFLDDPEMDLVSGGALVIGDEKVENPKILFDFSADELKAPTIENAVLNVPIPNARFYHKRVFDRIGLMDIQYPLIADRDFLFRAAVAGVKWAKVDEVVYYYVAHEGSLSINVNNNVMRRLNEKIGMAENYLQTGSLPPNARGVFQKWHNRETMEAALRSIAAGNVKDSFKFIKKGMQYDNRWLPLFLMSSSIRATRMGLRAITGAKPPQAN